MIRSVDIEASHLMTAEGRLADAASRAADHLDQLVARAVALDDAVLSRWDGPAHEVHIYGDVAVLVADEQCREHLLYLARNGGRAGVVVFWHGDRGEISAALAAASPVLSAALEEGEVFRCEAPVPRPGPPVNLSVVPSSELSSHQYSATLSIEVWVALMLGDGDRLVDIFNRVGHAGKDADGWLQGRRLLSQALRMAADCVLPGAGGTLPGKRIACTICPDEPLMRLDEVPGHLTFHAGRS